MYYECMMAKTDYVRFYFKMTHHYNKSILNFFNLKGKLVMFRKVSSSLVLIVLVVFFSLSFARVGMSGSMPEEGDAVYRDIDTSITSIKLVGHAGLYIGNFIVIHMQFPQIARGDLSNSFYVDYWGSFYSGGPLAAKARAKEATLLFIKNVGYSFINYKSFGDKNPCGRCDGLVQWCYAKAGTKVTDDNGWTTLSPQMQWKSSKITKRYSSARGKTAYNSALIGVDKKLEKLL